MRFKSTVLAAAICAGSLFSYSTASAANLLVNGDFETGDLTGWTPSIVDNGAYAGGPSVTSFDVTGTGASYAGFMAAGQSIYTPGGPGGGALQQDFFATGGPLNFSADVAFFNPDATYGAGGSDRFFVELGGIMHQVVVPYVPPLSTWRGKLQFQFTPFAGNRTLYVGVQRSYLPYQHHYFDNVVLEAATSAVPEPATWAMMIVGFGLVGSTLRASRGRRLAA